MQIPVYDDTSWLTSLFRVVGAYVADGINNSVRLPNRDPVGLGAYQITFDFPRADEITQKYPFRNEQGDPVTLIHFAIDDITNEPLGFGENIIQETPDQAEFFLTPEEAEKHLVNFDVGVWASEASGGSTARLVAYQTLHQIFGPPSQRQRFNSLTEGLQVLNFSGGRFLQETINDLIIFRTIDTELTVRAYSRHIVADQIIVDNIDIDPDLLFGDTVIIDVP